jgi:ribosomal protein L32
MDMDQDLGMDDDMDETQDSTSAVPVKKETVERKRKRRTVKKSKMEMDEKGYMGKFSTVYHYCSMLIKQ